MANFNKVLLVGRLTRDPELKHLSNQALAKIGLAIGDTYKTKDGEKREETTFVDCDAWGRTAEVMCQYLTKGSPVLVEGRLKFDQWQDKDGNKRSKLKVVIEKFEFIGGRGEGDQGGGQSNYAGSGNAGSGGAQSGGGGRPADDPIPF